MEARRFCPTRATSLSLPHPNIKRWNFLAGASRRWRSQPRPVPQLHDEAGDSGRLHPGRARELHTGRELLPPHKDR
jgi:hypothetical protein